MELYGEGYRYVNIHMPGVKESLWDLWERVDLDEYLLSNGMLMASKDCTQTIPMYLFIYEAWAASNYYHQIIKHPISESDVNNNRISLRAVFSFAERKYGLLLLIAKLGQGFLLGENEKSSYMAVYWRLINYLQRIEGFGLSSDWRMLNYENLEKIFDKLQKWGESELREFFKNAEKTNKPYRFGLEFNNWTRKIVADPWYKRSNCIGLLFNNKDEHIPVLYAVNGIDLGKKADEEIIRKIQTTLDISNIEWVRLVDEVEYLGKAKDRISFYDFRDFKNKYPEIEKNNRMFTCVERKLFVRYIKHKYNSMIIRWPLCYMCARSWKKLDTPPLIYPPLEDRGDLPSGLRKKYDGCAREILQSY